MNQLTTTTIRLPDLIKEETQRIAHAMSISMGRYINMAILEYNYKNKNIVNKSNKR